MPFYQKQPDITALNAIIQRYRNKFAEEQSKRTIATHH